MGISLWYFLNCSSCIFKSIDLQGYYNSHFALRIRHLKGEAAIQGIMPQSLVLCQIPFIDIPYLNVIVGFIALRLVGKLQFFAESASNFGFQHSFGGLFHL